MEKDTFVISEKHIPENAYRNRSDITHLKLRNVWSVGPGAFLGCKNLLSVDCENGPAVICEDAFSGCSRLSCVLFSDTLHTIGERAFACTALVRVHLPSSVSLIGNSAFEDCTFLEEISFPQHLKQIGSSAFSCCSSLKNIRLPQINVLHDGCFAQTGISSLDIPASVTYIGRDAFSGCSDLRILRFENNKIRLRATSFQYCSRLTHAFFPHVREEEHRVLPDGLNQKAISCNLDRFDREIHDPVTAFFRLAFPHALTSSVRDACSILVMQDKEKCAAYLRLIFPYLSAYQKDRVNSCAAELNIGALHMN